MSPADPSGGRDRAGDARTPARPAARPRAGEGDSVLVFSRRLSRVEEWQAEVEQFRKETSGHIKRLATLVAGGGTADDDAPPVPCYLTVEDPAEATAAVEDLAGWLTAVYLKFGDAELPPCWAWHPDAVYELTILRGSWAEAHFGKQRSVAAVREWLEKRPGVVQRLERLRRCELEAHLDDGPARSTYTRTAPLRSALPRVAGMWAAARDLPFPTTDDMTEALRQSPYALPDLDD